MARARAIGLSSPRGTLFVLSVLSAVASSAGCQQTVVFERADAGGDDSGPIGPVGCGPPLDGVMPESPIAILAVDRATSMNEPFGSAPGAPSKLYAARDAVGAIVSKYQAVVRFGYVAFPGFATGSCFQGTCCSYIDVPAPTLNIASYIDGELAFCDDPTNGCAVGPDRPTDKALSASLQSLTGPGSGHVNLAVVLVTDGPPGCTSSSSDPCSDSSAEVSSLTNVGARTSVVGLGTSPDDRCFNKLANLGTGTYSTPARSEDLRMALDGVVSKVARGACSIDYRSNTPDTSHWNLYLNDWNVPRGGQDGWDVEGPQIVLSGEACDTFLRSGLRSPSVYDCHH